MRASEDQTWHPLTGLHVGDRTGLEPHWVDPRVKFKVGNFWMQIVGKTAVLLTAVSKTPFRGAFLNLKMAWVRGILRVSLQVLPRIQLTDPSHPRFGGTQVRS